MLRKSSHRECISRPVDDEAEESPASPCDVEDLFASTDEVEESVSFTNDELFKSEAPELDKCSGCVSGFNKAAEILKCFNVPGFPEYPGSSWSLTVSKISAEIALPTLDAVFNFIVSFCRRGGISTEVESRAHRLHMQGVFQTLFQLCLMLAKLSLCL